MTPEELRKEGIVKQVERGGVKILGDGELRKALTVRADAFSKGAVAKIESVGGTTERIPGRQPPVRHKMRSAATPR